MSRKATDQVTMIGIDIGKNSFHLIGLKDRFGSILLKNSASSNFRRLSPQDAGNWGSEKQHMVCGLTPFGVFQQNRSTPVV
jgi:hypothetical protein